MSGDVPDAEATLGDRIFVMLGPAEEENAVLRMCLAEARAMIEPLQAHNESLACQLLEGPKTQVGVSEALDSEQLYVEREALQCELEYALESQSSYYLYREKSLLKELSMTVQQLGQLQIVLRAREKVAAQCSAQLDEEGARVEREKLNAEQWKNEASVHLAAAHDWKLEVEHWKTATSGGNARWREEAHAWDQALEKKDVEAERREKEVMRLKEEAQEWKQALENKDVEAERMEKEVMQWKKEAQGLKLALKEKRKEEEKEKNEKTREEARWEKGVEHWKEETQVWKQALEAKRLDEADAQKWEKEAMRLKEEVDACKNALEEKDRTAHLEVVKWDNEVAQWKEQYDMGKAEWKEALEWKHCHNEDAKKWQDKASKYEAEVSRLEHTIRENTLKWKTTEALLHAQIEDLDKKGRADTDEWKNEESPWPKECTHPQARTTALENETREWKNELACVQRQPDANPRRLNTRDIEYAMKSSEEMDSECHAGEKEHNKQHRALEQHNAQQVADSYVNLADAQEQLQHAHTNFLREEHCDSTARENDDNATSSATWEAEKRTLVHAKNHVQKAYNALREEHHSLRDELTAAQDSCWRADAEKKQLDHKCRLLLSQKQSAAVLPAVVVDNSSRPPSPGHSVRSSSQYDVARIDICRASLENKQLHSEKVSLKLELRATKEELNVKTQREVSLWDDLCTARAALQAAEERATRAESEYSRIREAANFDGQIMTRGLEEAHTETLHFLRQSEEWRIEATKHQTQIERLEAADRASIELRKQHHDAQLAEARLRELERQTEESMKRMQHELRSSWAKEKEDEGKEKEKWEEQLRALEATYKRELQAQRERLQETHADELRIAEGKWRTEMEIQCRTHDVEHRAELELQSKAVEANYRTKLDDLEQHIKTIEATYRTKLERYQLADERASSSNDKQLATMQRELEAEKAKCSMLQVQYRQSELTTAQFREQFDRAAQKEKTRVHDLGDQLDQLRVDLKDDLSLRASVEASTRWSKELEQQLIQLSGAPSCRGCSKESQAEHDFATQRGA
eukprot:GEMP01002190.1.p1 GENE.GEMP01002190.1~~GEMP01002190.1.p1  ORF type:complete len:1040 (+),score=353.24 GEMP01002190.1:45-3164(+)